MYLLFPGPLRQVAECVTPVAFGVHPKEHGKALMKHLPTFGAQMLRSSPVEISAGVPVATPLKRVFRDGFVVALLNPKTTVFFAAFLPQFLNPNAPPMFQSMALGFLFVAIAAVTDSTYALAAGVVAPALRRAAARRIGRRLGGGVFIGLGVFTALVGSRGAK